MPRLTSVLCFAVITTLGACDAFTSELDQLRLALDSPQYAHGQEALIVLDNNSERSFTYSPCGPQLERQTGETWSRVETDPVFCPSILVAVSPGDVVSFRREILNELEVGTYRFVQFVGRGEDQNDRVLSTSFRVME